jgi:hypothetical protein
MISPNMLRNRGDRGQKASDPEALGVLGDSVMLPSLWRLENISLTGMLWLACVRSHTEARPGLSTLPVTLETPWQKAVPSSLVIGDSNILVSVNIMGIYAAENGPGRGEYSDI